MNFLSTGFRNLKLSSLHNVFEMTLFLLSETIDKILILLVIYIYI